LEGVADVRAKALDKECRNAPDPIGSERKKYLGNLLQHQAL
jgi:hypothetical protein